MLFVNIKGVICALQQLHDIAVLVCLHFSLSAAGPLLLWKQAQLWVFLLMAATIAVLTRSLARFVLVVIGTTIFGLFLLYATAAGGQDAIFNQSHATVYVGLACYYSLVSRA